jgi:hypothetical protein
MRVAGVPGETGGGNGGGLATLHIFGAKERIGGRRRRDDGLTDDRHFELEHRHNAGKGLLINNRIGVGVVAIWDSQIDLEFIESVGD